jgi:hypothetical protein
LRKNYVVGFLKGFRGLIETLEAASAVSMKPPNLLPWSQLKPINPLPQFHLNCRIRFRGLTQTVEADHFK